MNHTYDCILIVNRLIETYHGIAVKQFSSEFADDILFLMQEGKMLQKKFHEKIFFSNITLFM